MEETANNPDPLALRPNDAAKALGISPRTLWTLTQAGQVPFVKIGRLTVYPVHLLREWLTAKAAPQNPQGY